MSCFASNMWVFPAFYQQIMISRRRSEGQFTQDSSHSKVVHNLLFQGMGRWWGDKESQLPREKKKRVIRAASLLRVEFDPLRLAIQFF